MRTVNKVHKLSIGSAGRNLTALSLGLSLSAALIFGCRASGETDPLPSVHFVASPQIGRWADSVGMAGGEGDSPDEVVEPGGGPTSGDAGMQGGAAGTMEATGTGGSRAGTGGTGTAGRGGVVTGQAGSGHAGTSAVGGAGGSGAAGSVGGGAKVAFSVLTMSQGGRFSPKNIGAIWIEDSSGKFVKTLAVWAATRARYLTKFNNEAGANRVDAVTSATLRSHMTHSVTWNGTTAAGAAAPDGSYKMLIEVTENDATGKFTSVDFTVPGTAVSPPDQQYFTAMQLTVQ